MILSDVMQLYVEDFHRKKEYSFVVPNSIPIIWFGDSNGYFQSETKIVTVGLNPSVNEFEDNGRKANRFDIVNLQDLNALSGTLNNYFEKNPYSWFLRGEHVLNLLDASYQGQYKPFIGKRYSNTALHIDIYSAIATNPTWGGLSDNQKSILQKTGLFQKLLCVLDPDVLLVSVNKTVFNQVFYGWNLYSEHYQNPNNHSTFYLRKYSKGNKRLYWIFNNQGTAFGVKQEFLRSNMP